MISIQIDMYYHAFHELYGNHKCLVASLGLKQARLLTLLPNFCCNESIYEWLMKVFHDQLTILANSQPELFILLLMSIFNIDLIVLFTEMIHLWHFKPTLTTQMLHD
jgi:hypothetical protein